MKNHSLGIPGFTEYNWEKWNDHIDKRKLTGVYYHQLFYSAYSHQNTEQIKEKDDWRKRVLEMYKEK